MNRNPLRDRWSAGKPAIGGWLSIPSQLTAEAVAVADLDYVCIDLQHGPIGFSDAVRMLPSLVLGGVTPLVRIPENTFANISTALDAGAMGVIIPLVNSPEEAEAAVSACRFPPVGQRSIGASRALLLEGDDYYEHADRAVACIPMIETMEAISVLDEILSVPGVDAVYVGPSDLALSMGFRPGATDPAYLNVLDSIVEACNRRDVVPGIHATPATAADRLARGYRMVSVLADLQALRAAIDLAVAAGRDPTRGKPSSPLY